MPFKERLRAVNGVLVRAVGRIAAAGMKQEDALSRNRLLNSNCTSGAVEECVCSSQLWQQRWKRAYIISKPSVDE